MPSKFTEILEAGYQTTSPRDDVRLEDIIAAEVARARHCSQASSRSASSSSVDSDRIEENPKRKRLSRLLSGNKK